MQFAEEDLLPISTLQHYVFCPRQCALIHLEQGWKENVLTTEGRILHERAHESGSETRGDEKTVRGLRLRSLSLGLIGQADVVQFTRSENTSAGVVLPYSSGRWLPLLVEYKRGRPKIDRCDEVQVCAQAFCIEEMLETKLTSASIFYGQPRRRHEVLLDKELRAETIDTIQAVRFMLESQKTPRAKFEKKCKSCSLFELCQPKLTSGSRSAKSYLSNFLENLRGDE